MTGFLTPTFATPHGDHITRECKCVPACVHRSRTDSSRHSPEICFVQRSCTASAFVVCVQSSAFARCLPTKCHVVGHEMQSSPHLCRGSHSSLFFPSLCFLYRVCFLGLEYFHGVGFLVLFFACVAETTAEVPIPLLPRKVNIPFRSFMSTLLAFLTKGTRGQLGLRTSSLSRRDGTPSKANWGRLGSFRTRGSHVTGRDRV